MSMEGVELETVWSDGNEDSSDDMYGSRSLDYMSIKNQKEVEKDESKYLGVRIVNADRFWEDEFFCSVGDPLICLDTEENILYINSKIDNDNLYNTASDRLMEAVNDHDIYDLGDITVNIDDEQMYLLERYEESEEELMEMLCVK